MDMQQKRYFIGLTLPELLSSEISKIQYSVYDSKIMLHPLVPHITLLPPEALLTLHPMHFVPLVKQASGSSLPLAISLEEPAMFDERVLYASVESPELVHLQAELIDLVPNKVKASFTVGREFTPHLTLAQAKPGQVLPQELIDSLTSQLNKLLPQNFVISNLSVFTWQHPRHYKVEPL
jgi:2'-5' RNA ligase